jgi:hypothetical protein
MTAAKALWSNDEWLMLEVAVVGHGANEFVEYGRIAHIAEDRFLSSALQFLRQARVLGIEQ